MSIKSLPTTVLTYFVIFVSAFMISVLIGSSLINALVAVLCVKFGSYIRNFIDMIIDRYKNKLDNNEKGV
jgi:uncharacterized membrane protein YpjA